MPTTKRKRDTSHGTRKKHQLQLFKNFWNDTFENSIPSINLNISTILICFRFTSCLETRGFCCYWNRVLFCSLVAICCTSGLPITFPCATIRNQLGDRRSVHDSGSPFPVSLLSPNISMSLSSSHLDFESNGLLTN